MNRFELFPIIDNSFNIAELQELCFKLGVEYENLSGDTKTQKVIELIGYFDRRQEIDRLEQAVRIARPNSFPEQTRPAVYKSALSFPFEIISDGLAAIARLSKPATWEHLTLSRPLTQSGWMGTDSDTLIKIFYALYQPVVAYQLNRYEFERNFSFLDWRTRIQYLLLEFVGLAISHDSKIAALEPAIDYTPRVKGWRLLREENPQKYWWQGLSSDRLGAAVDALCVFDSNSEKRMMNLYEFREYYNKLFQSDNAAAQQTLGLAANALYGFTPATRPVFWRLLVIQARLYHTILESRSESLKRPENIADLSTMFSKDVRQKLPFSDVRPEAQNFETFETTFKATTQFLEYVVIPQSILKLNASQYDAH